MLHGLALAILAATLAVVAWCARGRRWGWRPATRRLAEVAWIVGLTGLLVEAGATVLGLGALDERVYDNPIPRDPVALTVLDVTVPEDHVRERTRTPLVSFVGDSFTAGQGVHTGEALPDQVKVALGSRGIAIDDRNHGDCGASFETEALRYTAIYSSVDPDIVVWVFVLNDFGIRQFAGSDDFILDRRSDERTGVRALDAVLQVRAGRKLTAATLGGYREALRPGSPSWSLYGPQLRQMVDERRGAGGRFMFVIYPLLHDLSDYPFRAEHDRLAAWADAAGAEVVDLLPAFAGRDAARLWANPRDHHPNATAHGIAAKAIADAIAAGPMPRAARVRCELLPAAGMLSDRLRAACDQRDVASSLGLARAAAGAEQAERGLVAPMAALAAWRAVGTPEEAAVRAESESIIRAFEQGGSTTPTPPSVVP